MLESKLMTPSTVATTRAQRRPWPFFQAIQSQSPMLRMAPMTAPATTAWYVVLMSLLDSVGLDFASWSRMCDFKDDKVSNETTKETRLSPAPTHINRTASCMEGGCGTAWGTG